MEYQYHCIEKGVARWKCDEGVIIYKITENVKFFVSSHKKKGTLERETNLTQSRKTAKRERKKEQKGEKYFLLVFIFPFLLPVFA
jgi:hypothetical protein